MTPLSKCNLQLPPGPGRVPDGDHLVKHGPAQCVDGVAAPRTEYTAFASTKRRAVTARLIVRRVRRNEQGRAGELLPAWRYHAVFTDFHGKARGAAVRRHLIQLPARIARRGRDQLILHLPEHWPGTRLHRPVRGHPPGTTTQRARGLTGPHHVELRLPEGLRGPAAPTVDRARTRRRKR